MNIRRATLEIWARYSNVFVALFMLLVASLIFTLVLIYPPPVSITNLLFNFHIQTGLLVVVLFTLIFAKKGLGWEGISLVFVIVLFGLPLIYKWQTAKLTGIMLGGLLPFSDANGYYAGAQSLMTGSSLSEFATRRPLFSGFFSVLLALTENNSQTSLAILAAFHGAATFFAAREIQKAHTAFAAATFVIVCYWYYCGIAGTIMTENLGFGFGCLGLVFLLQGGQRKTLWKIGFGLFLLTIALNVRAGAFFILPALLLWFAITYKKDFGWKGFLFASMAVFVAMTGNVIFTRAVGHPQGAIFSNYPYTLYGLASGNAGWRQVERDFPNAKPDEIIELAIRKIQRKPAQFALGMARAFQEYFSARTGAFSFLRLIYASDTASRLLWILTWMGVATALFSFTRNLSWMVLFAFLGIVASTTLVPPKDADNMRVYAATLPMTAYLVALGVILPQVVLQKLGFVSPPSFVTEWRTDHLLLPFSICLLVACLVLPILIKGLGHFPQMARSLPCLSNERLVLFLMGRGSSVTLVNDQEVKESYLPAIKVSDFRYGVDLGPAMYPFLTQELLNLEPGYTISFGGYRNVTSQNPTFIQSGYLITDGQLRPPGAHQICVIPANDENLKDLFFYDRHALGEKNQPLALVQKDPDLAKIIRSFYGLGFLAILLGLFDFWSIPIAGKIFIFGNLVLILIGILMNLHSTLVYPLAWELRALQADHMVPVEGYAYEIDLGTDWMDRKLLGSSPAVVYENGSPLKHPNESPFNIKRRGKGRFSIQDGYLYFSSSDNSDPQKNGRLYEIYWPTPIPGLYRYGFYISCLVGVFSLVKYSRHGRKEVWNDSL
jgi:hypothetical protein